MTKSEYEKERCAFWDACFKIALSDAENYTIGDATNAADIGLAERDKRFPEPEGDSK